MSVYKFICLAIYCSLRDDPEIAFITSYLKQLIVSFEVKCVTWHKTNRTICSFHNNFG